MITTPTTREVSDQIVDDLAGTLAQTIPILPKAFVRVLAWALAGVFILLFKYAGFLLLNVFVAHASSKEVTVNGKKIIPLVEWGMLLGVGQPLAAVAAQLSISVTVKNQVGSLPSGSLLLYDATRIVYETVAAVALDAPTVTVTIKAIGDDAGGDGTGDAGNIPAGSILSFANTPANVATDATVVSSIVTGVDAEDIEFYRRRIVKRVQRRPQGGAYADYQAWAEEVPGIINVYPYAGELPGGSGPGYVDVYVEASLETAEDEDGTPTAAQLTAVEAAINLDVGGKATRRPANARLNVQPITRAAFAVQVSGLTPDTVEIQEAIQQGLVEYLRAREPFIVGLSVLPRDDRVTAAALSGIVDTIASAFGATVTTVEVTPGPAYTLGHGEKAKLDGDVNWV
ncbi:MAG TPA: baseplate J/gp47 family protein [Polyangiaceae bacterium]|nr:baseplate J/gp47 family protein [Polyangiaceae bacterium]